MTASPGDPHRSLPPSDVSAAREILAASDVVMVLTGAGISADSGVPTFRGQGGLWRSHRPEDLATPEAFRRDPHLVWAWYSWRREMVAACVPNAAHLALAEWQGRAGADVRIITQNVDGLHSRALERIGSGGADPRLLEVHGALHRSRCLDCGRRFEDRATRLEGPDLPRCSACGGSLRPDVVWFGEALDPGVIAKALGWAEDADVCLVVGTSALVHPAAALPEITRRAGGCIIEVNPEVTPLTASAAVSLRGGAAETIPAIVP